MLRLLVTVLFCLLVLDSNPLRSETGVSSDHPEATLQLGKASIASSIFFTQNMGQWPDNVLFRADAGGATIWIAKNAVYYQFTRVIKDESQTRLSRDLSPRLSRERGNPGSSAPDGLENMLIKASFVDANPNVQVTPSGMTDFKCNYFLGNDQTKWATDVPSYEAVTLHGIYEGVDLHFSGNARGNLTYEYQLAENADPRRISVDYEGLAGTVLEAAEGGSAQTKWGAVSGLLAAHARVTEFLGMYGKGQINSTPSNSLSPTADMSVALQYSTFLGGSSSNDFAYGIAVDASGSAIVVGATSTAGFPLQNPYDPTHNGSDDVTITKFSPSGSSLMYSTYVGGSVGDEGYGMALDESGNVFLTGYTISGDFPMMNAYDNSQNGGGGDAFVCKFAAAGNALLYSTYLGGSWQDYSVGIAVDTSGSAYVVGLSQNGGVPVQNPYDGSPNGDFDCFVSKLSPLGNSLIYSTLLGGSAFEGAYDVAVDDAGNAYVSGFTNSIDYPGQNAYNFNNSGGYDAFVTKLSALGNTLLFSSYFGGSADDFAYGMSIDSAGNVFMTGETHSTDLPVQSSFDGNLTGSSDIFVCKISSTASNLLYSTYLGGSGAGLELGEDLVVDASGNAYLTGRTNSSDFPIQNHVNVSHNGGFDAIVSKLSPSGNFLSYSIYLGGSSNEYGFNLTLDDSRNLYLSGRTESPNFPIRNAFDGSFNGSIDGFVTKISMEFICGDADGNGIVNISDAVFLINYIFSGGPASIPIQSGDADCNEIVTISDAVFLINYIFSGGPSPCSTCP